MAGHSKWAQIKRQKAVVDARRGVVFTRLAREITVAARQGADPAGNFQLRTAVEKARAAGVPNANIERAIAKGSGQGAGQGDSFEVVRYEGYGPGGVAVLVEALTDNRNRTAADVRLAFSKNGGNLGESGCVAYLFDQLGVVWLEGGEPLAEDPLLELLLELDVHSYRLDDRQGEIWCPIPSLEGLHRQLLAAGWPVQEAELRWRPQTLVELGDPDSLQQLERLLDSLDGLDDVRSVNCNLAA
ncbi:MAG: YebC/PmpR family DNA-binding transcriptional regulator [Prochlorococcaceae cyanobacterium]|jgi:YebC/PmpR family DNA-binding regulatory protein